MIKFSFILPAWKGRFLKEAISSILHQSYTFFELVVVDDCSPDPIFDIVSSFHDERVSYYRNKMNIGRTDLVAQWNHCLEYATGDYVILATDDDLYESCFLSSFVDLIMKYPKVDLFRSRILQINEKGKIKGIDNCYKEYLSQDEFVYYILYGMKGGIPQYIFRRNVLDKNGGFVSFPLAWASDDATAIVMAENGVVNNQEHLVRFRWSDLNISGNSRLGVQKVKARLEYACWLNNHIHTIEKRDEWSSFLAEKVNDYLPVYHKISLISTIKPLSLFQKMRSLLLVAEDKHLSSYDKMSIFIHTL